MLPLGLTVAHTINLFTSISTHISLKLEKKKKKKTTQISRNSIQFPYVYLSELAAQGIEMKQEASDNIISLFFNLFLLQHKHRLL